MVNSNKIILTGAIFSAALTTYFSSNLCGLPMLWRQVYFIVLAAVSLAINLGQGINKLSLLLFGACIISIVTNDIPSFFQPWERFTYFVAMLISIGPVLAGERSRNFRFFYWRALIWSFVVTSILSLGVYLVSWEPAFHAHNLLCGILTHSMNLGPTAGVSMVFLLSLVYENIIDVKSLPWSLMVLVFLCFVTCALSGSRIALLSCLVSVLIVTYATFAILTQRKIKYLSLLICAVLAFASLLIFSSWGERVFEAVVQKTAVGMEHYDSLMGSRERLWEARISEFKSSPVCGIGFCCVADPESYVEESGVIEPGSSWLFVLSSLGSVGGIVVLAIYMVPLCKLLARTAKGDALSRSLLAVMIYYLVHMFAEGYFLSAGNLSFPMVWSTIAVAWDHCSGNRNTLSKAKV